MKKIFILILFTVSLRAGSIIDLESTSPSPTGTWDYRNGTVYVATPTVSGQAANKDYVDLQVASGSVTYAVNSGTAAYSDNSGLLNSHDTDYFATSSDLSDTAASTGTIYSALQSTGAALSDETTRATNRENDIAVSTGTNYAAINSMAAALTSEINRATARENDIAVSTGTNKAAIDANVSNIADLQTSTGTNAQAIYDLRISTGENKAAIESNDSDIADLQASTGTLLAKSSATATYMNVSERDNYLISPATFTIGGGGGGTGGQPDICFALSGDVFNSTAPWKLTPQVSKYNFTTAKYDIDIGSATADSFTIRFAKKSFGGSYTAFEDVTIPASVSSHTYTSSGISISDGDIIEWGFLGVDATDAAGDISVILRD